jgi:hypothetical protein
MYEPIINFSVNEINFRLPENVIMNEFILYKKLDLGPDEPENLGKIRGIDLIINNESKKGSYLKVFTEIEGIEEFEISNIQVVTLPGEFDPTSTNPLQLFTKNEKDEMELFILQEEKSKLDDKYYYNNKDQHRFIQYFLNIIQTHFNLEKAMNKNLD